MDKIFNDRQWLSESLYLIKNLWKIAMFALIGALLAALVATQSPEIYRAQATYYLNKSDVSSTYFSINEYQFYNLLLLDVERMLESNKFYSEVMNAMDSSDAGARVSYEEFLENLYVEIDSESTFFMVGFDHRDSRVADSVSKVLESVLVEETSSIVRISSIELIDSTVLLARPVAPNIPMMVFLGAMLGIFVSALGLFIVHVMSNRVNSYMDVSTLTNQNLLCHARFNNLKSLNVEKIFDRRKKDDFLLVKQLLLYDKELHGQKVYSVLSNDESGKNETFALALAGHLAASGEKALFVPINPTDSFRELLSRNYDDKRKKMSDIQSTSRYNIVAEDVVHSLDVLLGTNRTIAFSQDKIDEINGMIAEYEAFYDVIIISIGLEERLIFSLKQRGAFMLAISSKSNKERVKSGVQCLDELEARVIGATYQE